MKKMKWYEKQWAITIISIVLFSTWYFIGAMCFNKHLIYESEVFAILVGILVTSGVVMITAEVFKTEYKRNDK